jgi:hypothetical protein
MKLTTHLRLLLMDLSPAATTSSSDTHTFCNILWNPKINFDVMKSSPLAPILSQINSVRTIPFFFYKNAELYFH